MRRALLLLLLFILQSITSTAIDTLTPARPLVDGETLVSGSETFVLGFFSPQGSKNRYVGIWYHQSKVSVQTIVWIANREHPIPDGLIGNLSIAGNGTLYITSNDSIVYNSSFPASPGLRDPVAQLLDNGNLVVREAAGSKDDSNNFAWQSFHYPTDTVLPGMKTGWFPKLGIHHRMVAWKNAGDPSPSEHYGYLDTRGYPQLLFWNGPRLTWRSGPWNGLRFSGIPEMTTFNMFSFQFVVKPDEVYYEFDVEDSSIISKLTLNQSGSAERLVWVAQYKTWNSYWSAPRDQCDTPSKCGPNGVCNAESYPICSCMPGFRPKDPATWDLRDGSAGCFRNTSLDCRTDGFTVLRGAKLPDTRRSTVDMNLTMEQCRKMCLSNCSCSAYANANISSGIGCLIWIEDLSDVRVYSYGGQDLFLRLAAADLARIDAGSKSHKKKLAIIMASSASGGVALAVVAYFVWRKSQSQRRRRKDEDDELELPVFDFKTISAATDEFSSQNMLGEGGFGFVYKGKLAEGQEIAVKRLSETSLQGVNEFKNEVSLIGKLQHRNLVRLLGCCIEREERMLVYEYMPNKSLDAFLFDKDNNGYLLSWETRYDIIIGVARGLLYLHQDSRLRIIHRDLKASNILLDRDMNPKISDFGLARMFCGDDAMNKTKRVMGTFGYMAPEYGLNGIFSVKSDVFSFGVLVLEIISGVRNKGVHHCGLEDYLLGKACNLWNEGRCLELVDPRISGNCSIAEVIRCISVGLLCVQEFPVDRPTMSSVVIMLSSDNMTLPEPKQPGFVPRGGSGSNSGGGVAAGAPFGKMESVNYLTMTMTVGR